MALWDKLSKTGNVEDRRGSSVGTLGGGLGVTGLVIYLALTFLGGGEVNVNDVFNQLENVQLEQNTAYDKKDFEGVDNYELFASRVLGSANEMWTKVFSGNGLTYHEPTLVLFRRNTESGCGGADSGSGPHYCPLDRTIYLDETFFEELTERLGAKGGDVAEAYVIAHEVGHHVQNELYGIEENISNEQSIARELQSDCFAGLWAYSIKDLGVFGDGEINEAIDAAASVGDDRIQAKSGGRVNPESWTHGSSEDRVNAFNKGYQTGSVKVCE